MKVQNARIPTARKGISARILSSLNQRNVSHAKSLREKSDKNHIITEIALRRNETKVCQGNVSHKMAKKHWHGGKEKFVAAVFARIECFQRRGLGRSKTEELEVEESGEMKGWI